MDLVCFSHLRWGFVFQRPNHLMSRSAREFRTHFIEEPVFEGNCAPRMEVREERPGLFVCTPRLQEGLAASELVAAQRELLDRMIDGRRIDPDVLWFYTPMALAFARHLHARTVVYDCMDELSAFDGAPASLPSLEAELFARASVVFTGGSSLYRSKRTRHPRVHEFPSSVDVEHFRKARRDATEPADQVGIPHPRIGFFGVIDERLDYTLIARLAHSRPEWSFVFLGPVVKVDPASLPRRRNLHWLGPKTYADLPSYVGGWDVAIMPFALNRATRFISPTKTLEYLAAGLPVVSTAIDDVVEPYGRAGVMAIADRDSFAAAIERALRPRSAQELAAAEALLARTSWDRTWSRMKRLVLGGRMSRGAGPVPLKEDANV